MKPVPMYRVYVGNLDSAVTEASLIDALRQEAFDPTAVVLKRGYAFVDFNDSTAFTEAIDQLNGSSLLGSILHVEASAISKRLRTNSIEILNLSQLTTTDALVELVSNFGQIEQYSDVRREDDSIQDGGFSAIVEFESSSAACRAFDHLNNKEFDGRVLRVQLLNADVKKTTQSDEQVVVSKNHVIQNVPLRILMTRESIGAIIGHKGQIIRRITAQTETRIDIHGKEATGMLEKIIKISGSVENCSIACREMITLAHREATLSNKEEITLRMLIDDRYCGRVIGRDGKTIKRIREETETRISISNVQEMAPLYPDRVITVKGKIDNVSKAENAISAKLHECYALDLCNSRMTSSGPVERDVSLLHYNSPTRSFVGCEVSFDCNNTTVTRDVTQSLSASRSQASAGRLASSPDTCYITIPNYAVGAIIGTAGANIKRIIRDSNAFVTVESRRNDHSPSGERVVTVKGNPDACWRASYFIFEKMKVEGFGSADGEVRLRTLISIPQSAAGRVIGRGGKNVQEVQRSTGAIITLPSMNSDREIKHADSDVGGSVPNGDVTVEIYGNFIATQGAFNRLRAIAHKTPVV